MNTYIIHVDHGFIWVRRKGTVDINKLKKKKGTGKENEVNSNKAETKIYSAI